MQNRTPQTPRSDARAAKVKRLTSFILDGIDASQRSPMRERPCCRVIAKSIDSAVFNAVVDQTEALLAADFSIRVILADRPDATPGGGMDQTALLAGDVRLVAHATLLEAHEQLSVGPDAVWTGDSLRRAPDKLDAFETQDDDAAAAVWAARSFERLWQLATPLQDAVDAPSGPLVARSATPKQVLSKSFDPQS